MTSNCGWDWSKPCTVEIEHKDGNYKNNRPENLTLICPNCHSQTLTYKGRNKGNGRWHRRKRYKEGLSF
jgi:ssDNA-binding Zn-finger/Zn-ribbon topoisomerase 1